MFLVAAAAVSAWLITVANIPGQVIALLQPLLGSPTLLMVAIMILVMLVGTSIDMTPTILILSPVLMPLVNAARIDPVYFGVALHDQHCDRPDHAAGRRRPQHRGRSRPAKHGWGRHAGSFLS